MTDRDSWQKRGPEDTLARIAELLNFPSNIFTHPSRESLDLAEAADLLQLWKSIKTPENRKRLLSFAKQLAAL